MKSLFDQMVEQHEAKTDERGRQNALYEVMQQVVLAGLARGGLDGTEASRSTNFVYDSLFRFA